MLAQFESGHHDYSEKQQLEDKFDKYCYQWREQRASHHRNEYPLRIRAYVALARNFELYLRQLRDDLVAVLSNQGPGNRQ